MATLEMIEMVKTVSFILYLTFIGASFVFGMIFLRLSREKKEEMTGFFFLCISLFFICLGIGYILRVLLTFFMPLDLQDFYDQLIERKNLSIQQLARVHAFFNYLGFAFLSVSVEYSVYKKRTKYILSILLITSITIILLFLPYKVAITFQVIPFSIAFITIGFLIFTYIYLGIKNAGQVRQKSFFISFGLVIYVIGVLLNNYLVLQEMAPDMLFFRYTIITPLLLTLGILLLYNGYRERK